MGHMKAARQGTRSTTKKKDKEIKEEKEEEEPPLEPPQPHLERAKNHQVICAVIPAKKLKGLVCTDLPGKFPIESALKNNYLHFHHVYAPACARACVQAVTALTKIPLLTRIAQTLSTVNIWTEAII